MNIFATDPDPVVSANALDDKRVNKMITESAQMLSTAIHLLGYAKTALQMGPIYKPAYVDHPCTRWARARDTHFMWLVFHATTLNTLYTNLNHRVHGAWPIIQTAGHLGRYMTFSAGRPDSFVNCARNESLGLDFTHMPVHLAYREYLLQRWVTDARVPRWTGRDMPAWVPEEIALKLKRGLAHETMNNANPSFLRRATDGINAG